MNFKKPNLRQYTRVLLLLLPLGSCQKMELEVAPVLTEEAAATYAIDRNHITADQASRLFTGMSEEETHLLIDAAKQSQTIHPYLQDYLLGEVYMSFESVLLEALQAWEAETCQAAGGRVLCTALQKAINNLS